MENQKEIEMENQNEIEIENQNIVQNQYKMIFQAYGHYSRIWDCKTLHDSVVSCGEDSTCIVWDFQGKQQKIFRGHAGKNIWCIDVNYDETELASGGQDGSIKLWSLLENKSLKLSSFQIPNYKTVKEIEVKEKPKKKRMKKKKKKKHKKKN
eukprot:Anaeramoba_ignava/a617517_17.p1 GENE.a617517_17~~a617517_17.p1  ORF type:complete len:169 (-),score=77.07 a617517_17:324-779(-)